MLRPLTAVAVLALLIGSGAGHRAHGQSMELVVIAHPGLDVRRMRASDLEAVFAARVRQLDGARVIPLNLPARSSVRAEFDRAVLGLDRDAVARYWIDRRIRDGSRPPRQVGTVNLMVRVVGALPGAVGYVPASTDVGGTRVVARIVNGRVRAP